MPTPSNGKLQARAVIWYQPQAGLVIPELSEAQLAGIGHWLSGIGLVALRNSFYMALAGDILKIKPIP
ncbi:hypothetical protein D1BOALGB6SA_123 [Olavius sp. associated proteobacterium Delta 1]|nr:hypothetical protein D1BOALGB6SA_123 [Olavius sp. associated proteobacterium Delta 1]